MKSSLLRLLENPPYREKFEWDYELFKLEVLILDAMEEKGWTHHDLARATGISRHNIWRDLESGGLQNASLERIARIVDALGLHLHPVLLDQKKETKILPKLRRVLAAA